MSVQLIDPNASAMMVKKRQELEYLGLVVVWSEFAPSNADADFIFMVLNENEGEVLQLRLYHRGYSNPNNGWVIFDERPD
jgi:phage-related tail fiber protein